MGRLDLSDVRTLKNLLRAHNLRAVHRLGQHFLVDRQILLRICAACGAQPGELVLEIGPGPGALTQVLLQGGARVLAIELDRAMVSLLQHTLGDAAGLTLVQADVLTVDLAAQLGRLLRPGERAKVAANLPYYITTPVVMRLLETALPLDRVVVTVQREVAERMVAGPGGKDYGALSIAVQYRAEAEIVLQVPRRAFWPVPAVDSAVVALQLRPQPAVAAPEAQFFRVVRAAFGQRRKTLGNALAGGMGIGKERAAALCAAAGIDPRRRGETLSLEEFAALARLAGDT